MKRKIITIDETKCNGCGLCVTACHEGAIALMNGKARLVSESYCDGLGACLPHCPMDAITIEEREAEAFDEAYALQHQQETLEQKNMGREQQSASCACHQIKSRWIAHTRAASVPIEQMRESQLMQWPCQIKLAPVKAPYYHQAHLLIAASCTAYAYASIHNDFMRGRVTLIGCPKLDGVDYAEKLTEILKNSEMKSITVLRMEVPCCGGIVNAVKQAIIQSENFIPWHVITLSTDGRIVED